MCFLYANRYPPPDQIRGHASLENTLARDDFSSNRHSALSFCLSMISGQTLRVCPEGKPVPTHRVVARGHAFPDHAPAATQAVSAAMRFHDLAAGYRELCL